MKFRYPLRVYVFFGDRVQWLRAESWEDAWSQVLNMTIAEQIGR